MPSSPKSTTPSLSVSTVDSTKSRKKRTIVVVRRTQNAKQNPDHRDPTCGGDENGGTPAQPRKKTVLVSRRPRASEGRLFEDNDATAGRGGVDGHRLPSSPGKLKRHSDGRVLENSVLGTAEAFEEMEAQLGWARSHDVKDDNSQGPGSVGSFHSQRSKMSFRSMRAGQRPSTGDRSVSDQASGGSGSPLGASLDHLTGLQKEMARYFRRIAEADDTATRNRAASARKEAKLLEHVGLTEKLTIQREGNSMRQWERWLRAWHRVSEDISGKTGKAPENLVMSTADDFRERSEEYQLIQSAIPPHDKFSSEGFWEMSLRGYGERMCNVGNIFSGLYCVLDDRLPPPRAIRKPTGRPADATRKRTWRNSEALALRKRELAPMIRNIRPQQFRPDDTGGLLVQGEDLLIWAAQSSHEYFQLRHARSIEAELTGRRNEEARKSTGLAMDGEVTDTGGAGDDQGRSGPVMEVLFSSVLLIESNAGGELKQATATVRNIGSTVLFFSWSRVLRGETVVSTHDPCGNTSRPGDSGHDVASAAGIEANGLGGRGPLGGEADAARHAASQDPDGRFFCHQTSGTLLPGETSITSFSFKSADPGVFSDRWRLETVPPAFFVFSPPTTVTSPGTPSLPMSNDKICTQLLGAVANESPPAGGRGDRTWAGGGDLGNALTAKSFKGTAHKSNQNEEKQLGSGTMAAPGSGRSEVLHWAEVGLRGVALSPDTRKHVRKRLAQGVARGVLAAKVEEIVREVVRGVRTPIREQEIRRRQRKAFLATNAERGLFFTPRIYDGFMSLLQRAKAIALAAEAGSYDKTAEDDTIAYPGTDIEHQIIGEEQQHQALEAKNTQSINDDSVAVPATKTTSGKTRDGDTGREDDERSSPSTRSASDRPSSGHINDDHSNADDDFERGDQPGGGKEAAVRVEEHAVDADGVALTVDVNSVSVEIGGETKRGSGVEIAIHRGAHQTTATELGNSSGEGGAAEAVVDIEALRDMLQALDCGEWDGAIGSVLDVVDGLTKWIPPPPVDNEPPPFSESPERHASFGQASNEGHSIGVSALQNSDDEKSASGGGSDQVGHGEEGGAEADSENDGDEDDEEESDEESADTDNESQAETGLYDEGAEENVHPLLREQRCLKAEWRRLLLDAQLEPEADCSALMQEEVGFMLEEVAGAMEDVRRAAGGVAGEGETPRRTVLGYDEESIKTWAAACPVDTFTDAEGGARARAAAAIKTGNFQAGFLALAYGEVSTKIAGAMENFESRLSIDEAGRRGTAASARRAAVLAYDEHRSKETPPLLSTLAALAREDIGGRRILLHVDLSKAGEDAGNPRTDSVGEAGQQLFSEEVRVVAEQVREMLSAKPAAVAIVSEMSCPLPPDTGESDVPSESLQSLESLPPPSSPPAVFGASLRSVAFAISSMLGMDVDFYESVPEMAAALGKCGTGGESPSFGARLMMAERLSAPGVVPAPLEEEPELSDGEEERLPDFTWGGEEAEAATAKAEDIEAARLAASGPGEGDFGAMLAEVVDVTVLDAPRTMYEPRRDLPWGPTPNTGLTVAGTGLHGDLTAVAYLTECADRPLLAIVGGGTLGPRLKLVDGLLDHVDTLAIGGGLAATFLAAAHAARREGGGVGGNRCRRVENWGKGTAGLPRDTPDVLEAARRLLVKARKRGVEVILPRDFVVGDVEVDEHGPLSGQTLPEDEDENKDEIDGIASGDGGGSESGDVALAGEIEPHAAETAAAAADGDGGEADVPVVDIEPEDPEIGFEYGGETMDVSLEGGIPRGFRAMDVGPQTVVAIRDAVARARAILWHGMLGVAECSAFQFGTREVLEAVTTAHDSEDAREAGTSPVVVLCGRSLAEWAARLVEMEDDAPSLGAGSGVSHVCTDPGFCTRVLEGRIIPGVSQLSERDPPPGDADLGKVLRRRPFEEDDMENDEEGEGSDGESSSNE